MGRIRKLEKFNTHSMSQEIVLAVATGRDALIENISKIIDENISHPKVIQHIVLTGPRGMGKSFLLRYFHILSQMREKEKGYVEFALLPEEQHNVNSPSQFLDELLVGPENNAALTKRAVWDNSDTNWGSSFNKLKEKINERVKEYGDYLFIAGVENLDLLLDTVFAKNVEQSRLRELLSSMPNFMLLGSSKRCDIDTNYNQRLFLAFQKYPLEPWTEEDYIYYFNKRYEILEREYPENFKNKDIRLLRNKMKAISKFTGGSPRMAVVLTNLLFDEDAISTAETLNDIVEDLSPYYQDLMEKMPEKSKILFDALVHSDENISQSKLAELVGAKQSDISKAFKWLLNNNFIQGIKIKGEKNYRYSITDRVFVLFYYKRFIYRGLEYNRIKIMADFLVSFYDTRELGSYAMKYLDSSYKNEGIEFARLVFDKEKIELSNINWESPDEIKSKLNVIMNSKENEKSNVDDSDNYEKNIEIHLKEYEKWKKEKNISNQAKELGQIGWNYKKLKQFEKAIEFHQKAYELREKEKNISSQAWNLGQIGWNYKELKQFEKAIEFHQKAYELSEIEKNISKQAWNLEQIGWNYKELKQFEKAVEFHKKAYELREKEKNISEQAYNLGEIGWNYTELKEFEKAIEYHLKAIKLKEKNIQQQAWNLEQIGWNYNELKEFEKAIESHLKAFDIYKMKKDVSGQAWNMEQIGLNYNHINQFSKAIESHKKASEFRKKEKNIFYQASNLAAIGWNYGKLKQFKLAIEFHKRASEVSKKSKNILANIWSLGQIGWNYREQKEFSKAIEYNKMAYELSKNEQHTYYQAWNLEQIAWNYKELKQFVKAIEFHQKAYELREKEKNISSQAWNLGQIGCNYLLNEMEEKAWKILKNNSNESILNEKIIKEYGDAVIFKERWEGKAVAFNMANIILSAINEKELHINKFDALKNLFASILNMKLPYDLVEDICSLTKKMFGEKEKDIIDAVLYTVKYLESGKDEKYLKQINPDIAITIKAIVEEANL